MPDLRPDTCSQKMNYRISFCAKHPGAKHLANTFTALLSIHPLYHADTHHAYIPLMSAASPSLALKTEPLPFQPN